MEEDFSTRRRSRFTFLFLTVVNVFFLTANLSGFVRGFKDLLFYVLSPTTTAASRIVQTEQGISQTIRELVRIHQENQQLKKTLEEYNYLDTEFKRVRDENLRLHQLIDLKTPGGKRSVVARVISREPGGWFQWVTIDKGSNQGLTIDAPVLAWTGDRLAALGRLSEVSGSTSKVVLVTNNLSALPVQIASLTEDGLLEGQNSPRLRVNYLPSESKVTIGCEVMTSPLSTVFPPGILVGTIDDIGEKGSENFRSANVRPAANFGSLREVVILVPSQE